MKNVKKVAKIISNIIFYILLLVIILLIGYIILINVYKKQDKLGDIPINFYTILTTSMTPTIKAGDIVITLKDKNNIYKTGDPITFVSEGNISKGVIITHRIIDTKIVNGSYFYYTKGDANNTADGSPVSATSVIGKVILKIPKAGFIQQFVVSKFGWLVVVVLPCLAIIVYDIVKIFEKMMKGKFFKESLKDSKTKAKREDLNKILDNKYVSPDLQEKLDEVYDNMGIDNRQVEILDDYDNNNNDSADVNVNTTTNTNANANANANTTNNNTNANTNDITNDFINIDNNSNNVNNANNNVIDNNSDVKGDDDCEIL